MSILQLRISLVILGALLATVLVGIFGFFIMTNRVDAPTIVNEEPKPRAPVSDLIRIEKPIEGERVSSPVEIVGSARGEWFFEAAFPVRLVSEGNATLATGIAAANPPAGGEWMTNDFIPFTARLSFPKQSKESRAFLVFENDNPSGLGELKREYRVGVILPGEKKKTLPTCVVTGCSSQICAEDPLFSTCEFKQEYACYRSAVCERQASGECAWTESAELTRCLKSAREK